MKTQGLSVPVMGGSRIGEAGSLYTLGMTLEEESAQNIEYPSELVFRISKEIARNPKFLKSDNDPNVNSGLQLTIIHQYWFINCNNCTILIQDVSNRVSCGEWWGILELCTVCSIFL